ncbi:MAG: septum formation initiator family protein [Candidatus Marinimicrobia bacterium]|nr:septum formation initiator family protein [Candidatus Neomarinimicrobiota bacterium]MBL7023146.1 septum formation initiator family protein [Candidatus Neomarinimicrobiota bacterium]MBL7109046.1 septum formation initiator family protein [Candidatus Neomarinimicrobiota bacterium]
MKKQRKYQTRKKNENKFKLPLIIFVVGIIILMISDLGLLDYFSLRRTEKALLSEIQYMKNHLDTLETEYEKLKTDDDYLIQIAREKFRMVKPGEKVFKVIDKRKVE